MWIASTRTKNIRKNILVGEFGDHYRLLILVSVSLLGPQSSLPFNFLWLPCILSCKWFLHICIATYTCTSSYRARDYILIHLNFLEPHPVWQVESERCLEQKFVFRLSSLKKYFSVIHSSKEYFYWWERSGTPVLMKLSCGEINTYFLYVRE